MSPFRARHAPRIDAHQHFWDLGSGRYDWPTAADGPIHRSFLPADLESELAGAGIDGTVLVQTTDSLADTDSMLAARLTHSFVTGVVGWVPLHDRGGAEAALLSRGPALSGVRHLIHREADPDWLVAPAVQPGLSLLAELELPFDVVAVFPDHLRHVPSVAARHPDLVLVVDHLAKPPFRSDGWDRWLAELRIAAAAPRVYAKISGLDTAAGAGWTVAELRPAFDAALDAFGPERLLFGSDWPVCRLVSTYQDVVGAMRSLVAALSPSEQDRILGGTATEVYRLPVG